MTRRLLSVVVRTLSGPVHDPVHFHQGPTGTPVCCYDRRCTSPRLEPDAA